MAKQLDKGSSSQVDSVQYFTCSACHREVSAEDGHSFDFCPYCGVELEN